MWTWLLAHRPGPLAAAAIGAVLFTGAMQVLPALNCG
jgi:hypothetical protein